MRFFNNQMNKDIEMNNTKNMKKIFVSIVVLSLSIIAVQAGTINLPHKYPRSAGGTNLLTNTTFNGTTGWTLTAIPQYDSTVSRTSDGSGSIKIPVNASNYAQIKSGLITDFELNTPYTISFYVKTQHEPVYVSACLHMYDADDNRTFSYSTGQSATSTTGEWQEVVCVVTVTDPNIEKIKVVIDKKISAIYTSDYYIDEVYLGKGISFEQAPVSSRQTFDGSKVKIDALGNWQVYENSEWKDFFPFGMYVGLARNDYIGFSEQGLNLVLSQQFRSQVEMAQDATSTFNPNGMRVGLRLQRYAIPGDAYWTHTLLENTINDLNSDLSETLLCYDWDNENNFTTWSYWFDMVNAIRDNDTSHPVYVLNGACGIQRLFSKRLSDVCGTYVGPAGIAMETGAFRFDVLQYLEKQDIPVSIAQLNHVEEENYGFRLRLYYALIMGAKGICWWGDARNDDGTENLTKVIENRAWWSSIPILRSEVDALIPIIKQPHWTSWSVSSSDSEILFGTRDYNDDGYMIIMNPEDTSSLVTFTLNGLAPTEVWNYFDDSFVTSVSSNQFTVLLSANSTAVYRLVDQNYPEVLINGNMETVDSPISDWTEVGSGTITRDINIKYSGSASCNIYNASTSYDTRLRQDFIALKPNTTYRFTGMMKTDNVIKADPSNNYSGAQIQLYAGGSNLFLPLIGESGSSDWHLVEKTFTTPVSPNIYWYVRLRLWDASGTVWFDNISLQELNHNYMLNGDMETAGLPIYDWSVVGNGTIARDSDIKYSGTASCKIYNALTSDDTRLRQDFVVLEPNTSYCFTAMMKTDSVVKDDPDNDFSGAIIQLYTGGGNWFFPIGLTGTNDWQLVEKEFTTPVAPNSNWFVRLRLWDASGTVWYDNVCLYKVP
jgi:Carbohydrate binding domain